MRYDNDNSCVNGFFPTDAEKTQRMSTSGAGTTCKLTITVPETMKAPVYVYYELDNFYQNHRRYVKSRSDDQLAGNEVVDDNCSPQLDRAGVNETASQRINPCGLVAWSFFNDTYAFAVDGSPVAVNEKGIAWKSDLEYKFGSYNASNFNTDPATRGGGTITGPVDENEHFVVWMRTAALSTFRKLWGKIEVDIPAGAIVTVDVANRYNTYKFDGSKHLVLSTTSWLGGKNDFLGFAYLAVGALCVALSLVFVYFNFYPPRRLGDSDELSWNKE